MPANNTRNSPATDRALKRVDEEGISYYQAALDEGIELSTIYRAKKRREEKRRREELKNE